MFVIPLSVWLIGTGVVTVLSAILAFVVGGATFISDLISHPLLTLSAALRTLCKAATALMLLVAVVAEFATKFHAHSAWVLAPDSRCSGRFMPDSSRVSPAPVRSAGSREDRAAAAGIPHQSRP